MNTNSNSVMQFINMIQSNKNPQQFVMNMLNEKANFNPVYKNLVDLVKVGDTKGIENIVRNIAEEKGINFDKEFNSFKQMFKR
mgnify:CR=1 FL=1